MEKEREREEFKEISRKWTHIALEKEERRGKNFAIESKTEKALVKFVDGKVEQLKAERGES
jgi:hypothetical protein